MAGSDVPHSCVGPVQRKNDFLTAETVSKENHSCILVDVGPSPFKTVSIIESMPVIVLRSELLCNWWRRVWQEDLFSCILCNAVCTGLSSVYILLMSKQVNPCLLAVLRSWHFLKMMVQLLSSKNEAWQLERERHDGLCRPQLHPLPYLSWSVRHFTELRQNECWQQSQVALVINHQQTYFLCNETVLWDL